MPFRFGAPGWQPVVGDWNGDGKVTIGALTRARPPGTCATAMVPVPRTSRRFSLVRGLAACRGGLEWKGTTTIGVVDPSTGTWYLRNANTAGGPSVTPFRYAHPGWVPMTGDWNARGSRGSGVSIPPVRPGI